MRKSAPLIGYPVDSKGKEITNKKGVEEHAVQMEIARIMMGSAFDGNMKDASANFQSRPRKKRFQAHKQLLQQLRGGLILWYQFLGAR